VILSFSFGRRENVEYLLSRELKSRANPQSISLDVLSRSEAIGFIQDLPAQFRIQLDHRLAYPFSPGALQMLVEHIAQTKTCSYSPGATEVAFAGLKPVVRLRGRGKMMSA
jgi:hypothetical protein